jgi:hypothetical protein
MAHVSRAVEGHPNKNHLRARKVKVYVQRFPGKVGTAAQRAPSAAPEYKVSVNGRFVQTGRLRADGSVEIHVPGGANVVLHTLGTDYQIVALEGIEPHDRLTGQQRRLSLLGYYPGGVDNTYGPGTDAAVLDFQADNGLDPKGHKVSGTAVELEAATYDKLKTVFGE